MQRRQFVEMSLFGGLALLSGCAGGEMLTGPRQRKITLRDDIDALRTSLQGSFEDVKGLIQGKYDNLWVSYPDASSEEESKEQLRLQFVSNAAASYPHLRIQKADGEVANLIWDRKSLSPAISFADDEGTVLERNGSLLTYSFAGALDGWEALQGKGLLDAGVKLLAAGFSVWLGVKLAGAVLSAIAFLAYTALILGLVMVAVDSRENVLAWIVENTGWSEAQLRAFFEEGLAGLESQLNRISEYVEAY